MKKKLDEIRLLIVDDSIVINRKLRCLVGNLSFITQIAHARNYKEAEIILDIMEPNALIVDIKMPGKSGIDLLDRIRETSLDPFIIILTNHSESNYRDVCLKKGADYFLDKSAEFEKIPDLLALACGKESSWESA